MLIKAGVDISRLKREIRRTLNPVDKFLRRFHRELTITSTYEGNHMPGSLHYADQAYDIDRPNIIFQPDIEDLKKELPKEVDVVWKPDHIHIEWDPKGA